MKTTLLALPFLLVVAFVVYAEGRFTGFAIWNSLPLAAGFAALCMSRRACSANRIGCAVFAAVAAAVVTLFHLAWWLDWNGTATGSSTAALAFIFVPVWALLFAIVAGGLTWGIVRAVGAARIAR